MRCFTGFALSGHQGPALRRKGISIPVEHWLASLTPTHFQNSKNLDIVESLRRNIFACTNIVARVHSIDMLTIIQITAPPKRFGHEPSAFRLDGRGVF